jgi:type IV pilus assembly protein PilY1
MSIDSNTGYISGTPAINTGNDPPTVYTVVITVQDGAATDSATVTLEVLDVLGLNGESFNVRVCASKDAPDGYSYNCEENNIDGNGDRIEFKHGLLQDFWDQAWFGLVDFDGSMDPDVTCMPQDNQASFFTAVENATPVAGITKLIDAEYWSTEVFRNPGAINGCDDPFDPAAHPSVPAYPNGMKCRKNFILMLTAGEGALTGSEVFDATDTPPLASPCDALTNDIEKNACYANVNDLRSTVDGKQDVATYVVNMMGTNGAILNSAAMDFGGGQYYGVENPSLIADRIKQALQDIIKRAASGTAASVLASGEGSGATLIQAVYYPVKRFDDSESNAYDEAKWIGRLSNFWFYVDPFFQNNSIREDSVGGTPPVLELKDDPAGTGDLIAELRFDPVLERVMADLFSDRDGDGDADDINGDSAVTSIGDAATTSDDAVTKDFEVVKSLWEAGMLLWQRDISSDPRTIYTNINNTVGAPTLFDYNDASLVTNSVVHDLLGVADIVNSTPGRDDETEAVMKYIHGFDPPGTRSRAVRFVDLNRDGKTDVAAERASRVWKLGDVINSTPNVSSWIPLNIYHKPPYADDTYEQYVKSSAYVNRGMVFAGGNDGMLHAFRLGKLELNWAGQGPYEKSRLINTDTSLPQKPLGYEEWAFIPRNVIPYLKYQLSEEYCHIYSVDLSPYVFDASFARDAAANVGVNECLDTDADPLVDPTYQNCKKTADSWRTVLIGGMRYGGACRDETVTCDSSNTVDTNLDGSIDNLDCVKTPVSGAGYSSYFALDTTNQDSPEFMWEFTHPNLGFATTGPAIVRICGIGDPDGAGPLLPQTDCTRNGKWIAVIGSGPTGPIREGSSQFLANSDQNLRLFLIDVATGELLRTIDTGVPYAFASSMLNTTNDSDMDYQDEALYIGYVKDNDPADANAGTWIQGGVGRLLTGENPDVSTWTWSVVIDDVGPVASAPTRLQNNLQKDLWLFFGTGRYFYEDAVGADDAAGTRHLVGIKEPCYDTTSPGNPLPVTCNTAVNPADLADVTAIAAGVNDPEGWYITLDPQEPATGSFEAERVITDPLSSSSGIVFYTTFKPYKDVCSIGGKSHIWAVYYASGGAAGDLLRGTALIQVSTGSIEKIDLGSAFSDKGGRRTSAIEGVPPIAQGFSIFKTPPPVERIIHMQEK